MSRLLRTGLAVVAALAAAHHRAAEEVPTEELATPRESPRALNGHVFQPSRLAPGPFSTTSFESATLAGYGEVEAPTFDREGNQTGTKKYPTGAYGQALEANFRLMPDVALRINLNGLIYTGTNGRALLVVGGTAQYGAILGVIAGRDIGETMRLAFVADFAEEPQLSVTIANAVINAIDNGNFDEKGLFTDEQRFRFTPGASFAFAPSAALGFVAEARYTWTRRASSDGEDSRRTRQGLTASGTAELDLDPLIRWPLGLQLGYRGEFPVGGGGIPTVHQVGLGAYYTRRVRLALGVETVWRHGEIRPDLRPRLDSDSAIAAIRLRYYW